MKNDAHDRDTIDSAEVEQWQAETDVLIVGGGGAGISAAIEAADAGAKVVVLEAASEAGGSTALAGGLIYMGGGTPTQKSLRLRRRHRGDVSNICYRRAGPNADVEKGAAVLRSHPRALRLADTPGRIVFKPEYYPDKHTNTPNEAALMITGNEDAWPDNTHAKPAPRGHKPQIKGDHGGIPLMKNLLRSAREKGVEIICDARALNIIKDGDSGGGIAARHRHADVLLQGA